MGKNGPGRRLYLPRSIFNGQFSQICKGIALMLFYQCPLHHMDDALVATEQQSETNPATADVTKPEEPSTPGLPSSTTCSPKTLPPVTPLLLDLPFEGTPSMGHPFFESLARPSQQKWAALLVAHSVIIMRREPGWIPQRWRLGVNTALHGAMTSCLN